MRPSTREIIRKVRDKKTSELVAALESEKPLNIFYTRPYRPGDKQKPGRGTPEDNKIFSVFTRLNYGPSLKRKGDMHAAVEEANIDQERIIYAREWKDVDTKELFYATNSSRTTVAGVLARSLILLDAMITLKDAINRGVTVDNPHKAPGKYVDDWAGEDFWLLGGYTLFSLTEDERLQHDIFYAACGNEGRTRKLYVNNIRHRSETLGSRYSLLRRISRARNRARNRDYRWSPFPMSPASSSAPWDAYEAYFREKRSVAAGTDDAVGGE